MTSWYTRSIIDVPTVEVQILRKVLWREYCLGLKIHAHNKMSSLKGVTQLEHNAPGCIISIRIPSSEIAKLHADKTIVDIYCKHLFAKLVKPTIPPTQISEAGSITGPTEASAIVFDKPPRITNRYDNIIDQLERKYYCESMVQSNKEAEENSADESDESEVDEGAEGDEKQAKELAPVKAKTKSNKRKVCSDDYDMEDPFIDDEELVLEVEASLKTNRTKTKHDGFFVSAGKLEVFSPKKAQKISSQATAKSSATTQKKETPNMISTSGGDIMAEDVAVQKEGEVSEKKKRKRRTKKELEEAALAKGAPSAVTSGTSAVEVSSPPPVIDHTPPPPVSQPSKPNPEMLVLEDQLSSPGGTAAVIKVKPEKVLPSWVPDEESLQVLAHFKECYEKTGIKLFKSSNIPKSLEEPLHDVDLVVLKAHTAESLQRTSGYYESLHSILGGEVAIGKVRNLLIRLRLKDKSNAVLQGIEEQVSALIADLKGAVGPCPEKLQPAYKAAKKALALANKADGGEGKDPTEGQNDDDEADKAEEGVASAASALNTTIDSIASVDPTIGSPAPNDVSAVNNSSGSAIGAQTVRYEFVCNWTKPMKARLVAIENALKLWRLQENMYREKLTVHDKKYLLEKDVSLIVRCYLYGIILL